ncbi:DsbA family protein [Pseudomonas aeruginosa]|uniref:DsbA family protein n=1 Tax=Pseudomonas aeruginosa TaxID=287 RepID=UPI000F7DDF39|nr:thioredoxin domain-containing protein [Pseudomonas aeruginosa]RTB44137.1 disulfide bond formation protein DsbA [Pseudomonas aeruginosa]
MNPLQPRSRTQILILMLAATLIGYAGVSWFLDRQDSRLASVSADAGPPGPPWRYGNAVARFTIIEYADLECPYCRDYAPILRHWINRNPDVNLEWRHFPLPSHEPLATQQARLAECAGETGGHVGFWTAVDSIFAQQGQGSGLHGDSDHPAASRALQACLESNRPDAVIQGQRQEGMAQGVTGTPTLRLLDNQTGQSLMLPGPADDNLLMSAFDMLAEQATTAIPGEIDNEQ